MPLKNRKVVYISKYAAYPPYGMESRQIYLSRELVNRGYTVQVFISTASHHLSKPAPAGKEMYDGIEINWIPSRSYKKAYGIGRIWSWIDFEWKLRRHFIKEKISDVSIVIVSSLSLLSVFNGTYLKRKHKAKFVLEIRDIWPLILTELTSVSKWHPLYVLLSIAEKVGYKYADLIVGTMPNLKEHVFKRVVVNTAVIQIPHLINDSYTHKSSHSYIFRLKDIRTKGYNTLLAYSGSISKSAGLHYLLQGAEELDKLRVAIVILGEGPLKSQLKEAFTQSNIFFLDRIAQNEVVAFLKDCDILYDGYLKSDIYKYGSSRNKYVEYCLAAKPIVVSYSGFPLFVEDYNCGLVVEPENTQTLITGIEKILNLSAQERFNMGQRSINYALDNLQIAAQIDKLESNLFIR